MKYIFRIIWVLIVYLLVNPFIFIVFIIINVLSIIYYLNFNNLVNYYDLSHEYSTGIFMDMTDDDSHNWDNTVNKILGLPLEDKVYRYYLTSWDYLTGKITQSNSYPKNR